MVLFTSMCNVLFCMFFKKVWSSRQPDRRENNVPFCFANPMNSCGKMGVTISGIPGRVFGGYILKKEPRCGHDVWKKDVNP